MMEFLSKSLDRLSSFFAPRKGLLPLLGILLIILNFVFRLLPGGWLSETDFFLHIGIILAILGFLFAWSL